MSDQIMEREHLLMIVKTYPTPSQRYGELTCTAGIRLSDLKWVRIYPYPFRLIEQDYRFSKWDIVEAPVVKSVGDPRPDSYRLYDSDQIKVTSKVDVRDKFWSERMCYIRRTACSDVAKFVGGILPDGINWGPSILPVPVAQGSGKLTWEYRGSEWTAKEIEKLSRAQADLEQNLFASENLKQRYRLLKKPPYMFRLNFADITGSNYRMPILDWEIYQLYFNSRLNSQNDEEALEKVRIKVEDVMFADNRDTYLILGNIYHRFKRPELLAVDGFIWPKRQDQLSLLED